MATFTGTGSYGSPIVMGLTPWTRTRVQAAGMAGAWPPFDDAERLLRYRDYEALIENRPQDVFARLQLSPDQKEKILLAVAIPELFCNVWADSVWTDPPTIELPSDAVGQQWEAIDEANQFSEVRGWESIFAAAMRGTSVLRLYRSEALGAITGDPVQIEEVSAGIFFPKLRKGSDRLLDYVVLAWEENRPKDDLRDEIWQVRQVHAIGNAGKYEITTDERRAKESDFKRVSFEQTDLDFLPFVDLHAARFSGRYWGISELSRGTSLFDDLDNTLSNIAEILEYHGKPMLQVPYSSLFGGTFAKGADRTLAIRNHEDADVSRYVTYDGQLSAQISELDKILELLFLTNEIPRTYFGLGLEGGSPSGTSLRLQLQNYLKKASRWQRRETMRLKTVIDYSLRIAGVGDPAARKAVITHGSPLPADDEQEARIETGLHAAGLTSLELAVRRLRRVPSNEVDEELARIENEKTASITVAQNAFGGTPPPAAGSGAPPPVPGRGGPPPSRRGGSSAARQG